MLVPVWLGRHLFALWVAEGHRQALDYFFERCFTEIGYVLIMSLEYFRVYELYTSATGLYLCLVIAKGSLMLASWIRQVGYLQLYSFPLVRQ